MKKYVIKCQKCKTKYEGLNKNQMIRDHGLKKIGKGYACECKEFVEKFMKKIDKKEKKKNYDYGDFQE